MKIAQQSPETLTIRDTAHLRVLTGIVLAIAGCFMFFLLAEFVGVAQFIFGGWIVYAVSAALALVGVRMMRTAANHTVLLDRSTHTVMLTELGLRGRRYTDLSFNDVEDVVLQETFYQGGKFIGKKYRVAFRCADGRMVPWTPNFSDERFDQEVCAAAAREFGGWDRARRDDAARAGTDRAPSATQTFEPPKANWGCTGALLILFFVVGLGMAANEVMQVRAARPVPAVVVASGVTRERDRKDERYLYKPSVGFRYTVNGVEYYGTRVLISETRSSWSWAHDLAGRYPVGAEVTAWYTPDAPANAFLVRRVSKLPYVFIGLPFLILALFGHTLRRRRGTERRIGRPVPVVRLDESDVRSEAAG